MNVDNNSNNIINNNINNNAQNQNDINNNINNAMNHNQLNFNNANNIHQKKYSRITISFLLILIINLIIEIYSIFSKLNYRKYVFQYSPIHDKNQYYRFISSYFIHYGIWHLMIELFFTYKLCNLFENMLGTIMSICFILISMITNSVLHFFMIPLTMSFFSVLRNSYDLNYDYESSLTSVLFAITTFYFTFQDKKNKRIDILYTFVLQCKYLSVTMLFVLYIVTPNKSFYSNLSGIISGYVLKFFPHIFLPRVNWIIDFEKKFCTLLQFNTIYRCISFKNSSMKNALSELDTDSFIDENLLKNESTNYESLFKNIGNQNQMSELSNNLPTDNNNNIN